MKRERRKKGLKMSFLYAKVKTFVRTLPIVCGEGNGWGSQAT